MTDTFVPSPSSLNNTDHHHQHDEEERGHSRDDEERLALNHIYKTWGFSSCGADNK